MLKSDGHPVIFNIAAAEMGDTADYLALSQSLSFPLLQTQAGVSHALDFTKKTQLNSGSQDVCVCVFVCVCVCEREREKTMSKQILGCTLHVSELHKHWLKSITK